MAYTEREAAAAAQIAEAQNAFTEHRRAEATVRALGGDFVWKAASDGDHLHRVSATGDLLKDFGPRSPQLEAIANAHESKKREAYAALEHWTRERNRMLQLNRAHQVGRLRVFSRDQPANRDDLSHARWVDADAAPSTADLPRPILLHE